MILNAERVTYLEPELRPEFERSGLRRYSDFTDGAVGEAVRSGRTSSTRRFKCERGEWFYVKAYRAGGGRRGRLFWRDKAALEARNYAIMRSVCGLNVPDVICHGARRRFGRIVDSFLVTRAVVGAVDVMEYLGSCDEAGRRVVLNKSAEMIRRMHAAGFFHIDLQIRNLLVERGGVRGGRIFVLDSSRGRLHDSRFLRWHGRLRDLSSLYKEGRRILRRTEQCRWLGRYLGARRVGELGRDIVQTLIADRASKDRAPLDRD